MGDGDKRSLLWSPEENILPSSEKDIKGKQKVDSDFLPDFPDHDVRIPIGSAVSEEAAVSRGELRNVWTPEPPLVPDDRVRRSSLWDSAVGLGDDLKTFSEDSDGKIREEETRDSKRVGEIEATDEEPPLDLLSQPKPVGEVEVTDERPLDLLSQPKPVGEVEATGERPLDLLSHGRWHGRWQGRSRGSQMNAVNYLEIEESSNHLRTEMKKPDQRKRNSMAARLSELLRPRPAASVDHKLAEPAHSCERKKIPDASKVKRVSRLNCSSVKKTHSIAERMPPEWAILLLGCLLGLSSGISVVLFNKGVHLIHDFAWAGTPDEGAAWLRTQKLVDIWHRILVIPVVGGVIVGMFHAVTDILDMIRAGQLQSPPQGSGSKIDWLAALKQVIKALQAALALGTGSSLGPEGPSVDIGKSWAHGLSNVMKNSKERRIALVAAGAAAGIASGFNAPVAGTFFAIETVLKPQHAENSPPLTTAMIILAAVISSTVSEVMLGQRPAFTVPPYELRSAAELPLYMLLGGICGIMSVVFTRLVAWFTRIFDFLKGQLGVPPSVTPAIGALMTGVIALQYPGVLYWGFTNVDEILKTGSTATAPGEGLLAQLTVAKIVASAMCKGSGLVGGLYAPSLFIGSAAGGVYGSIIGKAINKVTLGGNAVAHPQAYALVGMAALLASVCSVPLTSVLLLFELTRDYHILLPLMGAVGLAIWVAAVGNQKSNCARDSANQQSGVIYGLDALPSHRVWRRVEGHGSEVELVTLDNDDDPNAIYISEEVLMIECQATEAISKDFVKVNAMATVKESLGAMLAGGQRCALVVDENDLLEGIMSPCDLQREVLRAVDESVYSDAPVVVETDTILVAAICTSSIEYVSDGHKIMVCYPDTSLRTAQALMQSRGLLQLPVVTRVGRQWQDRGHKVVGVLHREQIPQCIKVEASKRISALLAQKAKDEDFSPVSEGAH